MIDAVITDTEPRALSRSSLLRGVVSLFWCAALIETIGKNEMRELKPLYESTLTLTLTLTRPPIPDTSMNSDILIEC